MKTLELITRTDIDGKWFIVRLTIKGISDSKFSRTYEEANTVFDAALDNFEILGKEEILRKEEFNDAIRTVYISTDTGECFESAPENYTGSLYDLKTDAPTEIVEKSMAIAKGTIRLAVDYLRDAGFAASR